MMELGKMGGAAYMMMWVNTHSNGAKVFAFPLFLMDFKLLGCIVIRLAINNRQCVFLVILSGFSHMWSACTLQVSMRVAPEPFR